MVIIFSYIIGLLMAFEPISDNDYFWHVVIGKWIDINKAIPSKELFSWWGTAKGYAWTSHEWLTEWIMYKIGDIGCLIAMLLIFLGLYILMTKMLKVKFNKWFDFRLLYLLLMTVFFKVTGPRPYIVSLILFAYFIYILFSYLDDEKPIFKKLIWTLPFIQILWANLHGGSSSLSYIFIIGILMCNFVLKLLPNKESRWGSFILKKDKVKTLLILLGTILVATCINPIGIDLVLYPFTNMTDANMINLILEWQSPNFHEFLGMYIFVMIFTPIISLILYHKKFKLYEIALLCLMLYMCLKSQRFIGMYGIYSTWILGKYFFVTEDIYNMIRKQFIKYERYIKYLFIICCVLATAYVAKVQIGNFTEVYSNHGFYSDEAVDKIIELNPKRMYNDFGAGGFLLYKLSERNKENDVHIFIYGLGDVFSNNILPDSIDIIRINKDPEKLLDKYNFDVILTVYNSPFRYYLDKHEDWKLYYEDERATIFIKTKK